MNYRKGNITLELIISVLLIGIIMSMCIYVPSKVSDEMRFNLFVREFIGDIREYALRNKDGDRPYRLHINEHGYEILNRKGIVVKSMKSDEGNIVIKAKTRRIIFEGLYRNTTTNIGMEVYFY